MDAWQTFYTTLVATAIGGVIAAYVGYWLAQRSASVSATYDIVKTILSEDFTERRRQIYFTIRSGKSVEDICRAAPSDTDIFMSRSNIIYLLNYYDTLTHCIEDGAMSKDVVRRTVWEIIKVDHDNFDEFIEVYANEFQKKPRPLFPALRRFRNQWG